MEWLLTPRSESNSTTGGQYSYSMKLTVCNNQDGDNQIHVMGVMTPNLPWYYPWTYSVTIQTDQNNGTCWIYNGPITQGTSTFNVVIPAVEGFALGDSLKATIYATGTNSTWPVSQASITWNGSGC